MHRNRYAMKTGRKEKVRAKTEARHPQRAPLERPLKPSGEGPKSSPIRAPHQKGEGPPTGDIIERDLPKKKSSRNCLKKKGRSKEGTGSESSCRRCSRNKEKTEKKGGKRRICTAKYHEGKRKETFRP